MYVLILCRKYLSTRYIALASIISVMLGVATMIVVNSVMKGFSVEMQSRIHAVLSDVVTWSVQSTTGRSATAARNLSGSLPMAQSVSTPPPEPPPDPDHHQRWFEQRAIPGDAGELSVFLHPNRRRNV